MGDQGDLIVMANAREANMFDERICPTCGKKFFKPIESVYKYRDGNHIKYTCSYTCWVKELKKRGRW